MKLHHTTPLLVSFKSILQHPTPSPGDAEPVQGKSLLGSVCCGGTVRDLWGEQMHPAGCVGSGTCQSFPAHTQSREYLKQHTSQEPAGEYIPVCYSSLLHHLSARPRRAQTGGKQDKSELHG